jgi:asparagine synthase (glutamine-hydrolysing)
MCGICGFAGWESEAGIQRGLLTEMKSVLAHRGPDGDGIHVDREIGLGIRRLGIIDLDTGEQPLYNEDQSVALVCNGEIYNYLELSDALKGRGHRFASRSDAEVAAHLYEEFELRFVEHLRGMFALALWDSSRRRLVLARDRVGIKPLHYVLTPDGRLYFASEQKAILKAGEIGREPDTAALRDLFLYGFIRGDRTLFSQIKKLPPAHLLVFENGRSRLVRYWQLPETEDSDSQGFGAEAWAERLLDKLEETVRLHLRSDVPVGAWLSAGVDSSGITALMCRLGAPPEAAFSLLFEGIPRDEISRFRTLDRYPGFPLEVIRVAAPLDSLRLLPESVWHVEDPFTAGVDIARLILADATAARTKVVLTGEGADEVFGGYWWYRWNRLLSPLSRLPRPLAGVVANRFVRRRWPGGCQPILFRSESELDWFQRFVGPPWVHEWWSLIFRPEMLREFERAERVERENQRALPFGGLSFSELQRYDLTLRLPNAVVHHLDRASMARSVEARVPFLDHELMELAAGIPHSLKVRGFTEKYILRRALGGVLPRQICWRRKAALTPPFSRWLREPLPGFARELLSGESLRKKGLFDRLGVQKLLRLHLEGAMDAGRILMTVLGVQLWDELFRQRTPWRGVV